MACFRPYLEQMASSDLSRKTIRPRQFSSKDQRIGAGCILNSARESKAEIPGQNLAAWSLLRVRHAVGAVPFLLAFGALPAVADTLPASCGAVGAKSYTPPAFTIPPVVLNRGTVITVTNASMAINGDTSSVRALVANPGPDGISLEEAVMATNNDPGTWVIQFAPALKGSTIVVDSAFGGTLPGLTGGNVTINGDINGDGQPDITLTTLSGAFAGIDVASGGNTIYALALRNFMYGVWITTPGAAVSGMTFSNITIGNLVMTDIQSEGIWLFSGGGTENTWDHLLITGNTITGNTSGPLLGIDLELESTNADTLQHTIIANNNIVLPILNAGGIAMNVGSQLGAAKNQALDTLIANNVISSPFPEFEIRIGTGVGAASGNLIDGVQVIGNQLGITGAAWATSTFPAGIVLVSGDAASDDAQPALRPIQYSENNIARNIGILSNTITGTGSFGIDLQVACCGNRNNTISGLSILGNTIAVTQLGVLLNGGGVGDSYSRTTSANTLSNVLIQANSIQATPVVQQPCNCYGAYDGYTGITFGGIQIWAGLTEPGNSVNGISIANNDVDTPLVGISLIAGLGGGAPQNSPPSPADNNVVSAAQIFCNQVDQAPTISVQHGFYTGIKGINVATGILDAHGNQVNQLSVYDNLVAGVLGDASLFANLAAATGNTISISNISAPVNGPQFAAAGLVNAATFQQRALAPGSLVSLFGLNLNGATVQFDGLSAPILFDSSSQLNLQVPWELQDKSNSSVTVTVNSVTSATQAVPVGVADPGIFSLGAPQGGQGAIVNLAGIVVDANSPAHAGDYLEIYSTGLGAVSNTPQTGAAATGSPLSYVVNHPAVTIGGVAAPVVFAGLAPGFIGLYQVNVQVPPGVAAGDALAVVLSIGVIASNTVTISVR